MGYRISPSPGLLLILCSVPNIFCLCPSKCSCSMKNRNVDCSGRSLTALPHGLQDNITQLNLSYNHLSNLDNQLTRFTNLRTLDLSHNLLKNLPSHLPRSLWEVYATNNNITLLYKLDTAYQWNLKVLDMSRNSLQRTVFINNTLTSLQLLNLSFNQLWTVPTNIPSNVLTIDLSHNSITQILPGTLVRMPKLQSLYLHNNRFTYIPNNAFDQIVHLQEITLHNNPWSCEDTQNMDYLIKWVAAKENTNLCASDTKGQTTELLLTPYEATKKITTEDIPLLTTTHSHFLEVQEIKLYKKIQISEVLSTTPLIPTDHLFIASTEDSQFTDDSSADGMIHLDFNNFGKEMDNFLSSNEVEEMEMYSPTVILGTDNGIQENAVPHNGPDLVMLSTTVSVKTQSTTVKLNAVSSSAAQKAVSLTIHFVSVCLMLKIL
ncbi:oligodendrocyte-myelin glycoprotein [Hyla sarda]|uniref:oligodendrocyte-myelin glycoprotein n=1 Tax=Hyla sarda TaxID=327740 RepID=UPI0024C26E98|nr:oligodendrocyte-myelin glycoprotein [Hyla sarda]XP_056412334.1 oligodendrocyte-myelin glycoprotein [Hyla sarda]XP_056412335.1 oligodendrocyte-myelin glycoprotein [Hyla sarda]